MPIWDKTLANLQKGHDRLTAFAQTFAERMRSEITIIRVRVQIDSVREKQGEQHRIIGRTLLEQRAAGTLPQTFELYFKSSEVTSALEKIAQYERDLENLRDELRSEARAVQEMPPRKDDEGI
jgi:hypothetical protein